MPWVRLDDRFPSHRKVALLSDRAFRLYVAALCWSSENLTEGHIQARELPVVVRLRGAKTAATELETAGLWDPTEAGWVIHDYLEYNPDRARVQADREANAARQQAWRDRKKAERDAKRNGGSNGPRNAVTPETEEPGNDSSATRRRHDDDTTERETGLANQSLPQVGAFRNGVNNAAPSRPLPTASPTEKQASYACATESGTVGPQIPDFARSLVEEMTRAGMVVGWRLGETEWFAVHGHIKRTSIAAMVAFARARWNASDPPQTARYLTRVWADMPSFPAPADGVLALPAAVGETFAAAPKSRAQAETDDLFDRAMTRALNRMTQEGS